MPKLLPAFDLGPATRALQRRKDKPALAAGNALKSLRDARSALHDLLYAKELTDFLKQEDPRQNAERILPASARGAFLSIAILMYVRATQAGNQIQGETRKHLSIRKELSEEHQELHDQLVRLRNKAIAHLDYERPFRDKSFADEKLVVVHEMSGGHRFDLADRRIVFQLGLEMELRELLKITIPIAWKIVHDRINDAANHLRAITKEEPEIGRLIQRHPFDAVAFFGHEEKAANFLEKGSAGFEPSKDLIIFDDWPDA